LIHFYKRCVRNFVSLILTMPELSHPDVVVASVGGLVDDNEVVPHDLHVVEDDEVLGEVFQDSSSDTSGISEASSAGCSDKGEALFSPALYLQRYQAVVEYLTTSSTMSVLDTGCNNCRFLKVLQNLPDVRLVVGMDIDKGLLEEQARFLAPLPADWLHGRKEELLLEVWWGSVGDRKSARVMSGRVQAVTSIELIEHLDPDTLEQFPVTVLGEIKPMMWVVSTPNREYNTLFPEWVGPFRHWDHRFEWDREEFRDWAGKVISMFSEYTVEFGGVGFTEGCEESHGPASQIAVFRRKGEFDDMGVSEVRKETAWEEIVSYTFPKKVDIRTREEKIHDEAVYYARMLAVDIREKEEVEGNVLVQIEDLFRFDGLNRLTEDVEEVTKILEVGGYEVDRVKVGVIIEGDPEVELSDDEDYESWISDAEASSQFQVDESEEVEEWG